MYEVGGDGYTGDVVFELCGDGTCLDVHTITYSSAVDCSLAENKIQMIDSSVFLQTANGNAILDGSFNDNVIVNLA